LQVSDEARIRTAIGLAALPIDTSYRTGERDPIEGFYRPCLRSAVSYARAVGYFRSTVFLVIGEPMVDFARRGGHMRLICSPSITEEDAQSIAAGYEQRIRLVEQTLNQDLDAMLADERSAYRARVLATLVKSGALDIRLALRPSAIGIYHEKIGIFQDQHAQRVSFLGSANETWSAWHRDGNHESIEVFREWHSAAEGERVRSHAAHFERLWAGEVNGIETLPFPEAQRQRLLDLALADLDEIERERLADAPPRRTPMPHQVDAIEAWERAGRHGIFEHATGSGKTFTALTAIKKHIAQGLPALILVPSQLLLEQWAKESREDLPEATFLLAGAGHTKWKSKGRLRAMTTPSVVEPRVVISTMQTAATEDFMRAVYGGQHLMLVADEVHQIGSRFNAQAMAIPSGASMGLSATPTRFGDPEGTNRVFERFGNVIPPPITLRDAINAGRLVNYEYYPHPIHLTVDEAQEWKDLTKKISLEIARGDNDDGAAGGRLSEFAKMLLIKRSRIAKKAQAKPGLAAAVIGKEFEEGQRWLVYCEDSEQLAEVMLRLRDLGVKPIEYHSAMAGDQVAALDWFRTFGGVLVSIRCLDEGVDIPAVTHALILASSQNPRQFIQRRGRVLRKAPGKHIAVIHDLIVVPVSLEDEPEQMSLLKAEFVRAMEFSDSAINKMAGAQLRAIAISMGFDYQCGANDGVEEEIK
jgi:superfamily II DNA or RNA helicase